ARRFPAMGRAPARDRHLDRTGRLPQALRLHPRQRRHARLLAAGAGVALEPGARAAREALQDARRLRRRSAPRRARLLPAPRGDLLPQPPQSEAAEDEGRAQVARLPPRGGGRMAAGPYARRPRARAGRRAVELGRPLARARALLKTGTYPVFS